GASLAAVQELLRSVAFRNVSDDPVAGPRTVRFRLDDGSLGFSAAVTTTVTLAAVNDAPVVTVPAGPLTTPENTNLRVTDLTVADADADPARVQVSLAVTGGTVLLGIAPGVTMTGNGTTAVTAVGAVANLNAALTGMTFLPATNFNGFATVRVTADDLGNEPGPALTGTDTFSIAVGSVNNPPVNRLPAGPLATNEDTPLTITGLSVTDADAGAANVRVTLAVDHGTVVVRTNVAGGVVAGQVSANGSGAVTLDAPLAAVNATLAAGVVYTPSQDFFGNNTLTVTSDDLGNTGGPAGVDVDPLVIVVASLNDAPTFAVNVPTITLDEDASATTVSGVTSGASPGPADEAGQTLSWSVAVGTVSGNLAFTSPPSFNPATGTLSFAVAPNTNGTATVNVTLTDSGSGTAPNANVTTRPITVVVNAVNDAPSFTLAGNPPAVDQGTGRHDVPNFATGFQRGPAAATDEANQTPTYLLAVTGTTGTLAFTAGPTISAAGTLSYAAAAGTSGTATVSVKVRDSGGTAFGGQDTSAAQTFAITVNRVFVPPTATNDAARVPQGSPATVVDVLANDAPAPVTGGALTISGVTPAARGSVAVTGGGTGLTYTPAARYAGADSFTYTVRDVNGSTATATVQVTVSPVATAYDLVAVGSVSDSRVTVYNATTKTFVTEFFAFGPAFPGGVKVAVGDVNGDGTADVIVGAGLGGAPHVKVIDGTKLGTLLPDGSIPDTALLASFFAFDSTVRGGVFVAAGDVNGDGKADVIVSPGVGGGPHVKVIDGTKLKASNFGSDGQPLATSLLGSFFAYAPTVRNGLSVAAADVNRDGYVDVITGAGPGGAPHVKVIDGRKLGVSDGSGQPAADALLASYFAYSAAFPGGVNVTGGDLDGDGYAEVITAAGVGGGPDVRVYDGRTGQLRTSFFAFDSASTFGVDVAYRLRADGVPTLAVSELGGIGRFRNYARAALDPV
ncbi:MAG: cadherin-like domain-containing protein, partial [Gemmataceae bacterium]|nr:cadherin-like domain-containing protein [Gemmataceae bacterium]